MGADNAADSPWNSPNQLFPAFMDQVDPRRLEMLNARLFPQAGDGGTERVAMALDSDEECDSDAGFEVVAAQDHARAADSQHARHAALLPPAKRRRDIPANAPESPRLFDQHDQHSFDSAAGAPVAAASSKGTPEGVTLPCPGSQPPTVRQSTARSRRPALEDNNTNHSEAASERGGPTGSVSDSQGAPPGKRSPAARAVGRLGRAEGQQTLDRFIGWTAAQAAALGDPRDSAREGVSALAHVTTASSGQRNGGGERGRGRGAWAAGGAGEAGEAGAWGVAVKEELAAAHARAAEAEEQAARLAAELAAAKAEAEAAKAQAAELRASVEAAAAEKSAREQEVRAACRDLARAYGRAEREADVLRLGVVKMQCGNIVSRRIGTHLMEDWEPGLESLAREKEKEALVQLQGEITAERKRLRRCLPPPGVETSMSGDYIAPEEWSRRDEAMHVRLEAIKRELKRIEADEVKHGVERNRVLREIQRQRAQAASGFKNFEVLDGRYVLLNLLGKGGFSEVYKSFDLQELRFVACKIHQLGSEWSEEHKQSYIRHAVREYKIHRDLDHPHIVRLKDVFEVSSDAFATVMEVCEGGDLDQHLKKHGSLPEKEAKAITVQVLDVLKYLSQSAPRRVIHYDLKPPNILFDALGQARVTDFGLSKEVNPGETMGQDLTSRGAGTYWYLPPECFDTRPVISSKVDVWSLGCIVFQMVYGRRPFGEDMSQVEFGRRREFERARDFEPPATTGKGGTSGAKVSVECRNFIKRCLTYRHEARPDAAELASDDWVKSLRK